MSRSQKKLSLFAKDIEKLKKSPLFKIGSIIVVAVSVTSSVLFFIFQNRIEFIQQEKAIVKQKHELELKGLQAINYQEVAKLKQQIVHLEQKFDLVQTKITAEEKIIEKEWEVFEKTKALWRQQKELIARK